MTVFVMFCHGRLNFFLFVFVCILLWSLLSFGLFPYLYIVQVLFKFGESERKECLIPHLNPWDAEVIEAVQNVSLPLICNKTKPDLTFLTQDGILKFHLTLINSYLLDCDNTTITKSSNSINCSYSCVRRGNGDKEILFDTPISLDLLNDTKIDCELVQVNCFLNDTLEYAQIHSQIVPNHTRLEELDKILSPKEDNKHHNIMLFILDSTSRLNFERFCPKTLRVMQNNYKAVNFQGLTRHGKDSWENALAFFAGKSFEKYSNDVIYNKFWDNWPFIWKNYSQNGYVTLDNQEGPSIFLYMKMGFLHQPTDHRNRMFWLAASRLYNYSESDYNDPCCRNNAKHKIQLDYHQRFFNAYEKRAKFAFFWNTALGHDINEQLAYLDEDFVSFLQKNDDLIKNSFLFIMGDHGQRWGRLFDTKVGHFETHMPVLIASIPEDIRLEHPQILANMQNNSNKLISHYDTFVTLHDILASEKHGWDNMTSQKDWSHLQVDVAKAQSYLRPLDRDRTCGEIGISPSDCICQQQTNYIARETNYSLAVNLSTAIVDKLNKIVSLEKKCALMTLSRVLKLDELSFLSSYEKYRDKKRTFRLSIQVNPSNGTFEGIVRFDGESFSTDQTIERTNKYGNQFYCIDKSKARIRQYCYCSGES